MTSKILVVDDSITIQKIVAMAFEKEDACVEGIGNGSEALVKLKQFKPDIVLLDLMMPGLDGFSVCRLLKEDPSSSSIRIIAMTGYHTPENVKQIVSAGAETCLAKPLNLEALFSAIGITLPERID